MNIKNLINKLKSLPADTPVMVQGYEDGFDIVKNVREILVIKNPNAREWNGEYEKAEKDSKKAVFAIVILGNRR